MRDASLLDAFASSGHVVADASIVERRRELRLFGCDFELCYVPQRGARGGIPGAGTAFRAHPGFRIRREEAFWRGDGLVATPNRFPFLGASFLLWNEGGCAREVDAAFLAPAFSHVEAAGACLLANTVGASASIALAHAHVTLVAPPLLRDGAWPATCELARRGDSLILATMPGASWPFLSVEVRSPDPRRRAAWVAQVLASRACPAANLLAVGDRAFILPRRAECGGAAFPFAIGASELSGRWIFADEERFEAATAAGLEACLDAACVRACEKEAEAVARVAERIVDEHATP